MFVSQRLQPISMVDPSLGFQVVGVSVAFHCHFCTDVLPREVDLVNTLLGDLFQNRVVDFINLLVRLAVVHGHPLLQLIASAGKGSS